MKVLRLTKHIFFYFMLYAPVDPGFGAWLLRVAMRALAREAGLYGSGAKI